MVGESLDMQTCQKCGASSTQLVDIDAGMRLILKSKSDTDLPNKVCSGCYTSLTTQVSQGAKMRLEQQAKEKNRHMIWKSRVNLIKHARQMMSQKAYPQAAVSYEKYIRVLEMSYDLKPGQLSPKVFGNSTRSKELTVIATTYWDLMRIYDTMPQYRSRMAAAAEKLANFLPYSPIYADIMKRAQALIATAKNPDILKDFLRKSKVGGGRCFIATATFESQFHPVVIDLRLFRDHTLKATRGGRLLILVYYFLSPPIARFISRNRWTQPIFRCLLTATRHILIFFLRSPLV